MNREPTPVDQLAGLVLRGEIGEVLVERTADCKDRFPDDPAITRARRADDRPSGSVHLFDRL